MKFKIMFFLLMTGTLEIEAQVVFACIVGNKKYVVGAANAPTGLMVSLDASRWESLCWPNIRSFDAAAVPGTECRTLFIASGNGVFRTFDGGVHWKIVSGWNITEVQEIETIGSYSIVCIGTAYGFCVSTDFGDHWESRNSGLESTFVSALEMDQKNPSILWIGTEDGLYRTGDLGIKWIRTNQIPMTVRCIEQHPLEPAILLSGTEDEGVYRSENSGISWIRTKGLSGRTVYDIAFDSENPETVYAAVHGEGVYRSDDKGKTWKMKSHGLTNLIVHCIAAVPGKGFLLAGTIGDGIFLSRDRSESWSASGLEGAQVWEILIESGVHNE